MEEQVVIRLDRRNAQLIDRILREALVHTTDGEELAAIQLARELIEYGLN